MNNTNHCQYFLFETIAFQFQETFPPSIYYKIFTHRPVIDLCANSPKDYTKASVKRLVARQCHNKEHYVSCEGIYLHCKLVYIYCVL